MGGRLANKYSNIMSMVNICQVDSCGNQSSWVCKQEVASMQIYCAWHPDYIL